MSKGKLDKLLHSSWLSEVNKVQKQYEIINGSAHQVTAISNMHKQMETLRQSLVMQEPKWLKETMALTGHSNRFLKNLEQPEWLKTIKRFEELSRQTNLALKNSGAYSSLMKSAELLNSSFHEPKWKSIFEQSNQLLKTAERTDWMKSISRIDEISSQSFKAFELGESYNRIIESAKAASQLYNLEAFETIANLRNSPLNRFTELADRAFTESNYNGNIHDLDDDINTEIAQANDYEKLPASVQNKIIDYLKIIFFTIFLNLL